MSRAKVRYQQGSIARQPWINQPDARSNYPQRLAKVWNSILDFSTNARKVRIVLYSIAPGRSYAIPCAKTLK
jgi:hypothetical protein